MMRASTSNAEKRCLFPYQLRIASVLFSSVRLPRRNPRWSDRVFPNAQHPGKRLPSFIVPDGEVPNWGARSVTSIIAANGSFAGFR